MGSETASEPVYGVATPFAAAYAAAQRARLTDPVWLAQQELLMRAHQAEVYVWKVFPAAIAAVLADDLRARIEVDFRFEAGARAKALIDDILARPIPDRVS